MRLSKIFVVLLTGAVWAQKTPVTLPAPSGIVTGRVICGDTQLPARFAEISLVRMPSKAEIAEIFAPNADTDAIKETIDVLQERTGLDGVYTIRQVPPGDYWVVAKRDGYIFPIASVSDENAARDLDRIMARAALVHVAADQLAKADVSLTRGGVVSGRAAFDDGSPAVTWDVWLVPVEAKSLNNQPSQYDGISEAADGMERLGYSTTDDDGNFRLAGIPPGKYLMVAQLSIDSGARRKDDGYMGSLTEQKLLVYGPGVFARAQAKPVEIHGSETVSADLKLDLSHLHSIRGRVLRKGDGLPLNEPAIVNVFSENYAQSARTGPDGSFHVDYLPAGTYTLSVIPSFPDAKDRTRHFEHPSQPVVVGDEDVTLDDILLSEVKVKGNE